MHSTVNYSSVNYSSVKGAVSEVTDLSLVWRAAVTLGFDYIVEEQ